jgi:hypothetical protein
MTAQLKTRPPTGAVPWPVVLIEGEEKAGKTYAAALLSTSERVGQTYWLDLGEGSGDEYGAIPGARYLILEHDGTYLSWLGQIEAVRAEAQRAADAGEKPVVLVIDTMTDEWEGLKDWTTQRARRRKVNDKRSDEDLVISTDLWNDATARHRRLMTVLLTFPGIVVLTARGKEVVAMGDDGKPKQGAPKDYKVEGHKTLAYDASLWLRMSRTAPALIVGARSVHAGVRPGYDKPNAAPKDVTNLIEWAVFDVLRCDPTAAQTRDLRPATGGDTDEEKVRRVIGAVIEEAGWDRAVIHAKFKAQYGVESKAGTLDQLGEFLSELQTDAAYEAEQSAADEAARDEAAA